MIVKILDFGRSKLCSLNKELLYFLSQENENWKLFLMKIVHFVSKEYGANKNV